MTGGARFVAAIAEGEADVTACASEAEADGYARGYVDGACAYGAGSIEVYVLPRDEARMVQERSADVVEMIRRMVAARRPTTTAASGEAESARGRVEALEEALRELLDDHMTLIADCGSAGYGMTKSSEINDRLRALLAQGEGEAGR